MSQNSTYRRLIARSPELARRVCELLPASARMVECAHGQAYWTARFSLHERILLVEYGRGFLNAYEISPSGTTHLAAPDPRDIEAAAVEIVGAFVAATACAGAP